MIVQFVILLWRGFNHVKILDWNVNKSASPYYIKGIDQLEKRGFESGSIR